MAREKLATWRIQCVYSVVVQLPEGQDPVSLNGYDITNLVKSRRCKEVTVGAIEPRDCQRHIGPWHGYEQAEWEDHPDNEGW